VEEKYSIQLYLNDIELLWQTAEQVKKDFSFFDLSIVFSGNKETAYHELSEQIGPHIRKLMDEQYEKFLSLMYRVDILEKQLKQVDPSGNVDQQITDLILKRCLQKVVLRKLFSR
jgi:hypothetical protein